LTERAWNKWIFKNSKIDNIFLNINILKY
jgi:hypothetical protein